MRARLLVMTLALGLVAHVGTTAAVAAGGDFHRISVSKAGFSMEIPRSWATVDFTRKQASTILNKLRDANPQLASVLPSNFASAAASRVQLYAIDKSGGQFHENVNVILSGDESLPTIANMKAQLSTIASGPVAVKKTRVGGKSGLQAAYVINLSRDGSLVSHVTQYLVVGGEGGLIFSFATKDDGRTSPTVKHMVASLRLT